MKKLLLFDGLSIANRAFYGVPLLTNKAGLYTNAVYGFLNIMLSLIEKEQPDLVGIAFDVSKPTFRHIQSPTYKGTRKGMPEELRPQIPLLKQVLTTMGFFMLEKEGFEADDLLGTLAKAGESAGFHVVVVSGDRDLLQITTEAIELKIPKTKQTGTEIESYYAKDVIEKYGVTPTAFIDVKGLMGDASDNIKGVPGVGEKTATKLVKEYGSIENLYNHIDQITQKKLKENLVTYKEQALESKMLATIVCDVALTYSWEDFQFELVLSAESANLLKELEFKKIVAKLPTASSEQQEMSVLPTSILTTETLNNLLQAEIIAISYMIGESSVGISVCNGEQVGYVELSQGNMPILEPFKQLFQQQDKLVIVHNSKKFRHVLAPYGIELNNQVFDSEIAAYLLSPTTSSYELCEVEELVCGTTRLLTDEAWLGKGKQQKSLHDLSEEEKLTVLSQRAHVLFTLYPLLTTELSDKNLTELFDTIEMPLVKVLFEMEREGIYVDKEELIRFGQKLDTLITTTEDIIYNEVGEKFNINSPKQLGTILFEKMDIPPVKKTKTGYSTSAEVLEGLRDRYPIVEKILEYRQYTKLKSTYVDGLLQVIGEDGCIHSTFWQTVTATGRISSTEPNLQNIPIKLTLGQEIRKVFVPRSKECVFVDADYSQIELRVLAAMAKDDTFIHAFQENIDIHTLTASQVFHVPFEEVTSLQRSHAKAVNFGIVYGIGAFSLADDMKVSVKEAQQYIDGYFAKYQQVKTYLEKTVEEATQKGYVETLWHRRREIPELSAKNFNLREFGKRVAMNTPIQGSAADIIKIAMIKVHDALKNKGLQTKLILTVHDELLLEVPKQEVPVVMDLVKYEMEHAVSLAVPLEVEIHSGENWMEAK